MCLSVALCIPVFIEREREREAERPTHPQRHRGRVRKVKIVAVRVCQKSLGTRAKYSYQTISRRLIFFLPRTFSFGILFQCTVIDHYICVALLNKDKYVCYFVLLPFSFFSCCWKGCLAIPELLTVINHFNSEEC